MTHSQRYGAGGSIFNIFKWRTYRASLQRHGRPRGGGARLYPGDRSPASPGQRLPVDASPAARADPPGRTPPSGGSPRRRLPHSPRRAAAAGAPRGCAPLRARRHTSRAAPSPRSGGVHHRPARILHFLATGQPLFLQSASCWLLPAETKGGRAGQSRAGRSGGCPLPSSHPDPSRPGRVRKFKFF